MNRDESKNRLKDYYQLKADLVDVQLEKGSTKLVLTFEKRTDPGYSAERIGQLSGFVVCSIKNIESRTEKTQQTQLHGFDTRLV